MNNNKLGKEEKNERKIKNIQTGNDICLYPYRVPTIQTLEKICEGFDITLAQFFAGDEEIPDLTADQKQLLYDWNAMDEHQKELVKAYIQGIIRK